MGSDGLMQALIKGWDMFPLRFDLDVLNYINMYIHLCARTHRSSVTSMFKVNQAEPNKGRE